MTISPQMQKRLDKIQALVNEGYTLDKKYGLPIFKTSEDKAKPVGGLKAPTGFSWIAFFFPFAVCTQIREWSYFYITGIFFLLLSFIHIIFGVEASGPGSLALGILYGYNYPYLRYISNKKGTEEIPVFISIILGLVLSIICVIPSIVIDIIAEYMHAPT